MGQANSRGAAHHHGDDGQRRRLRPLSWAPPLRRSTQPAPEPEPERDAHDDGSSNHGRHGTLPNTHATAAPASPPSRRMSQRLNPFRRLSSYHNHNHNHNHTRPDAGSSGSSSPSTLPASPLRPRPRPRPRSRLSLGSVTGLLRPSISSRNTEPAYSLAATPLSPPPPPRSALRHAHSEHGPYLPHVQIPDLDVDFDRLLDTTAAASAATAASVSPSPLRRDGRALSMLPRLRNTLNSSRRRRSIWHDDDNMDNIERLRRGEDQADVLSRLLSLAAAATAASLVGEDHQAATRDGTFDTFLQSLQNGSIASALRGNEGGDGAEAVGGNPAPLNFFRMFRFGTSVDPSTGSSATAAGNASGGEGQEADEDGEGRMVPIIIVGIRSINPASGSGQDDGNIPPFLDALSSFPTPPTSPGDNENVLRPPQNGTRFSHRRRASMGGFNFPSNYDSQRHHRAQTQERPQPWSSLADSPAGPQPPPSTPATYAGLSADPSGTTTPTASISPSSSGTQSTVPSRRESFVRRSPGATLEPTEEEPPTHHRSPRQRRLSESDFTRYGSGAPRRRGVVEPDNNPGEGSRSWIIYVLGGSYPENHPILTTPSLFTDSPTYEDMMLLSSILGPAKAPVASEEDVAAAPGLFKIRSISGTLVAQAVDSDEVVDLASDTRCLVCLCDFEAEEEARKLVKCEHLFHKICIDQWLTTGRNSCPLCRGQGVDETPTPDQPDVPSTPPAASPVA